MKGIHVVGLTGQTGAGKSTVSSLFRARGIKVIDCDQVSRDVVSGEKSCLADLALEFSIAILNMDGTLNRKKLASIVFGNPQKLSKLNELIFPHIRAEINRRVKELAKQGVPLVVLDAPTLFESGADADCELIISVLAPEAERLNRIVVRDHLTDQEARRRMASQHDDAFYSSRSQLVIMNDGDPELLHIKTLETIDLLERALRELNASEQTQDGSASDPEGAI